MALPGQWDWYGEWSPDGKRFLFLSDGSQDGRFELDRASRVSRFLAPAEEPPAWSRDGTVMTWSVPARRVR